MIPKHLVTTWICAPAQDRFRDDHRLLFERCLRSWLRLMPDYRVTIITLGNLFDFGRTAWVEALVRDGNYIGASNWARLQWLFYCGGVYLDIDVEALRRFDPLLEDESLLVGHMGPSSHWVNNAVTIAPAGHPALADLLAAIEDCDPADPQFGNHTGPRLVTRWLRSHGWSGRNEPAHVHGVSVLPSAAFYPYTWTEVFRPECVQPETFAVHHWGQSWFPRAGLAELRPVQATAPSGG